MNHGAAASKTKGDNYLSIKNSESLDNYIQNTLASLYPPFEATAATVLWQLFSIVEKYYNGDGLRCLIDFLVPAKKILQSIQQETCSGYAGLIFCHEGWPLCIHEKVVVQLASLRKVRLKPGDFYFQIVPVEKQSANLVLKCLSRNGQGIEEFIVPETMYGYIFTAEFLENVNCEWDANPLQNCLLTTGPATYRTPWKNIVNPIFVPTAESILQKYPNNCLLERLLNSSPDPKAMTQTMESNSLYESSTSNDTCSTVIEVPFENSCGNQDNDDSGLCQGPQSQAETQCLQTLAVVEGVDVLNSRPHPDGCLKTGSVAEEVIHEPEKRLELTPEYSKEDTSLSPLVKGNGAKSIAFGTNLGSPCQKRRESLYFETKRLFRKSYIEALQNPMNLGSSSEESIAEEDPSDHVIHSGQVDGNSKITEKMHKHRVQQGSFWIARLSKQEDTNEAVRLGEASQTSGKLPISQIISPTEVCRESSDGTQSSNKSCMSSQNKDCKPSVSPCRLSNANSPKIVNGNLATLKKPDSHIHEFITTKNKKDESKEDSRDSRTDFQDCEFKVTCWQENELLSTNHGDPDHLIPSQLFEVNQELLQSGVISLCGNRDRAGRAIVQVCMKNTAWLGEHSRVNELTQLLAYFYSIPRKDVRALGLLVLVDIRKSQTVSVLFKALSALQTAVPHSIHSALILVEKESSFRPDKEIPFQCEVLTSLKALHRFIDCAQLTVEFDGMFPYNHNDWICFRKKLEPFITNCKEAVVFLQHSVSSLNTSLIPSTAQEVVDLMNKHKTMMKLVLEDELLVSLRLEGGTILARLRKEEFCNTEDYRIAMETITKLYNQVDEEIHRLVLLSNKCFQHLENLLAIRSFEEGRDEIKVWFEKEKEKYLGSLDQEQLSSENVKKLYEEFRIFNEKAIHYSQKGLQLIKENSLQKSEEECEVFHKYLSNITIQTQKRRSELENMVKLYEFYEEAHKWMVHCNEYLKQLSLEGKYSQSAIQSLKSYHQEAAKISAENFQKVSEVITALSNKQFELHQWNTLWLKCQQARHHLEEELSKAIKGFSKGENSFTPKEFDPRSSHELGSMATLWHRHSSSICSSIEDNIWDSMVVFQDGSLPADVSSFLSQEDTTQIIPMCSTIIPSASQPLTPWLGRFQRTTSVSEDLDNISTCYSEPIQTSITRHRKHPLKKIIKKTQSFELTRHESNHSELHHHRYTGVYIKGLEVASITPAEKRNTQRSSMKSPSASRNCSLVSPSVIYHTEDQEEKKKGGRGLLKILVKHVLLRVMSNFMSQCGQFPSYAYSVSWTGRLQLPGCKSAPEEAETFRSKVNHIMDEMITTEREYVRSLGYIINSYFPEMERDDLPQDLRGKRNIIFGNLEKLYDFHCHYFLKELEHCTDFPLRVSHCFLRHEEQFGMYALYSKNKPQSDTLLISHGNTFFKNKQQALGDKMNLASYLLKPIQRMSKYALLLKDLIKECSAEQEQELSALSAAEEMVKFQLRHGNDLLAMDAIKGCDVNLKEQGPLRCQDEFLVCCGRKKYLRHIFLFEDLILFSKTKKIDGGYDIYMYKQSFKTAEIGMTENVGDSGLRFEIWFRRRRKSQDAYILQANSTETKRAWTDIIGKILWRQALRNRELRMQEMVSMGIGNKPFMDIKPSDAAISDRAIDYIMKGAESRTRASIAVSSFDHSTPFKRPHSTISNSSTSSSSSQSSSSILGSLNLHVHSTPSHSGLVGPPFYHWSYDVRTCIEEDELEQEIGSQPSMTTESSESSQCTSGESACGFSSSVQDEFPPFVNKTFVDERSKFPSESASPALSEKNPRPKPSKEYSATDGLI